ncbi:MAG: hypothetical protein AB8I08_33935 [Sandaracinaceae bacterium]
MPFGCRWWVAPWLLALLALGGCAQGSFDDAGTPEQRPPTTIVDAGWLDDVELPAPMAPLPLHRTAEVGDLATHDVCGDCHANIEGVPAMRDEAERPVAPDDLWRSSMMSLSARDPYWLAVLSFEREQNPEQVAAVDALCTRCHAPAAREASDADEMPLTFELITEDTSPLAHLARDGVTCTLCHGIDASNLGSAESFVGAFVLAPGRAMFGPHADPDAVTMTSSTGFVATEGQHILRSAVCGTCHTVISRALDDAGEETGPAFPEQVPYLEWRNSAFNDEVAAPGPDARSCAGCHVPTESVDGVPIATAMASAPARIVPRMPYGRHNFRGGNAYMLEVLAEQGEWLGADVRPSALSAASAETEENLRAAAQLTMDVTVGGEIQATVRIENLTGHRFPTGYPSRRAFVRLTVEDATGVVLWRSGRQHARGGLTARGGDRLDYPGAWSPHFQEITREDQVQIYQAVMADTDGAPTRSLLRASRYLKDNRILPRGWDPGHPDASMTAPVGTDDDDDFTAGQDTVRYRFPTPPGAAVVRAELVFQAIPAPAIEHLYASPTPAIARFDAMRRARPDRGRVVSAVETPVE